MRYGQSVWGTSSWPARWLLLHSTWGPNPDKGKLPKMQLPRWHLSFGCSTVRRGKSPREDHVLYEQRKGRKVWEMSSEHTWFLRKVFKKRPKWILTFGGIFPSVERTHCSSPDRNNRSRGKSSQASLSVLSFGLLQLRVWTAAMFSVTWAGWPSRYQSQDTL